MEQLKKDILKDNIRSHYEAKDYTEVVRDAILCMCNEVRKKSDLIDADGVDLINKAFSEKSPLIKINKLETDTDKNKQRGINDLSKGLIEYFRNPMSHSKQEYSKSVADAILTLLDEVILEEIVDSKSINSIDDWYSEIINELTPNTERYAKNLVETIPSNKRYELSIMLYRNRNKLSKLKDKIIDALVTTLTVDDFQEYCNVIEKDLFGAINEELVISALKFISNSIWNSFSDLTKSKLEDMVLEDVSTLEFDYYQDYEIGYVEQENGYKLLESSLHIIKNFSNKNDIFDILFDKIRTGNEYTEKHIVDNYLQLLINNSVDINSSFVIYAIDRLRYKNKPYWYSSLSEILLTLDKDNVWYLALADAFKIKDNKELDPFADPFISDSDLPF